MFEAIFPDFCHEAQVSCKRGLSVEVTQTSLRWHWHQKAMVNSGKARHIEGVVKIQCVPQSQKMGQGYQGALWTSRQGGSWEDKP